MATKSQVKASIKYDKTNTKDIRLKLNLNTDADIIEYLEACGNKQGEIKRLIREEIQRKSHSQ